MSLASSVYGTTRCGTSVPSLLLHLHPERQVVAVVVAVVLEAAVVDHQAARVRAVAAGVPAQRPLAAGELAQDRRVPMPMCSRSVASSHVLVVDPAPAVAGDLVAELDAGRRQLGVALQRHRDAEHGERQAALLELAQDAPDADARAVLVDRLHAHVARRVGRRRRPSRTGSCSLPASPCSTLFSPPSS